MTEREKNPYFLSTEERTYPPGGGKEWLDSIIAIQRKGIKDIGFQPQNLFEVPRYLKGKWRDQVWNYYRSTRSEEEQEAIRRKTGPGIERHTRKLRHVDR